MKKEVTSSTSWDHQPGEDDLAAPAPVPSSSPPLLPRRAPHLHRQSVASTSSFRSAGTAPPVYASSSSPGLATAKTGSKPPPYEVLVMGLALEREEEAAYEVDPETQGAERHDVVSSLGEVEPSVTEEEEDEDEDPSQPLSQLDLLVLRSSQLLETSQSILASTMSSRAEFSRLFSLEDSLESSLRYEGEMRQALDVRDELEMETEELGRAVDDFVDFKLGVPRRRIEGELSISPVDPRSFLCPATIRGAPPRIHTTYVSAEVNAPVPSLPVSRSTSPSPSPLQIPTSSINIPERSSSILGTWRSTSEVLAGVIQGFTETPPSSTPPPSAAASLLSAIAANSPPRIRHTASASISFTPSAAMTTPPTSRRHSLAVPLVGFASASPSREPVATIFESDDIEPPSTPPLAGPSTPSLYHPPVRLRTPATPSPSPTHRRSRSRPPPPTLSRFIPSPTLNSTSTPPLATTPSFSTSDLGLDEFPLVPRHSTRAPSPSPSMSSNFVPPLSKRNSLSVAEDSPHDATAGDLDSSPLHKRSLMELKERLEAQVGKKGEWEGKSAGSWWNGWT